MTEVQYLSASGVPVYAYPNPGLHGFCICLYLFAGNLYEEPEKQGISHFYEHIAPRSLNRRMNGKLYETLDRYGLTLDAATSKQTVEFSISGAVRHFNIAAQLITGLFAPLSVSSADAETEKKRIKAEIREESSNSSFFAFTEAEIWKGTPLAGSITGTPGTLNKLRLRDLNDARKTLLSANNIFFYLTGNVSEENIRVLLDCLAHCSVPVTAPKRTNSVPLPPQFLNREHAVHVKYSDTTAVSFTFDIDVSSHTDAERVLLYDILTAGDSSRLYQELSEKTGYVYSCSPYMETYRNCGIYSFSFEVAPAKLLPAVETAVRVFNSLKKDVSESLPLVRAPYTDNAELLYDDPEDFNWIRAYECHILNLPYPSVRDRIAAYEAVSPQRLSEMARSIFVRRGLTFTLEGNQKKLPVSMISSILDKLG